MAHLILFDGVCGLCDRSVQAVLAHDRAGQFVFAPLQGALAAEVLAPHGREAADLDTIYVVPEYGRPGARLLWRGDAVKFVMRRMDGLWGVIGRLIAFLPSRLVDRGYRFIAARRYRWFGRRESCRLPDAGARAKFLELPARPS